MFSPIRSQPNLQPTSYLNNLERATDTSPHQCSQTIIISYVHISSTCNEYLCEIHNTITLYNTFLSWFLKYKTQCKELRGFILNPTLSWYIIFTITKWLILEANINGIDLKESAASVLAPLMIGAFLRKTWLLKCIYVIVHIYEMRIVVS